MQNFTTALKTIDPAVRSIRIDVQSDLDDGAELASIWAGAVFADGGLEESDGLLQPPLAQGKLDGQECRADLPAALEAAGWATDGEWERYDRDRYDRIHILTATR